MTASMRCGLSGWRRRRSWRAWRERASLGARRRSGRASGGGAREWRQSARRSRRRRWAGEARKVGHLEVLLSIFCWYSRSSFLRSSAFFSKSLRGRESSSTGIFLGKEKFLEWAGLSARQASRKAGEGSTVARSSSLPSSWSQKMQFESRSTRISGECSLLPWKPRKWLSVLSMKVASTPGKCALSFLRLATSGRGKPKTIFSTISALQLRIRWWLQVNGAMQLTRNSAHRLAAASLRPTKMIVFSMNSAASSSSASQQASTEKNTAQVCLASAYSAARPAGGTVPRQCLSCAHSWPSSGWRAMQQPTRRASGSSFCASARLRVRLRERKSWGAREWQGGWRRAWTRARRARCSGRKGKQVSTAQTFSTRHTSCSLRWQCFSSLIGMKSGTRRQTANSARKGLHPPRKTCSLSGGSLKSPFRFTTNASPSPSGPTSSSRFSSSRLSTVSRQAAAPSGKHRLATSRRYSALRVAQCLLKLKCVNCSMRSSRSSGAASRRRRSSSVSGAITRKSSSRQLPTLSCAASLALSLPLWASRACRFENCSSCGTNSRACPSRFRSALGELNRDSPEQASSRPGVAMPSCVDLHRPSPSASALSSPATRSLSARLRSSFLVRCSFSLRRRAASARAAFFQATSESQRRRYSSMVCACASMVVLSLRMRSQGSSGSLSPLRFILLIFPRRALMGASQICVNVGVGREEAGSDRAPHPHAPNPDIYPEVGEFPSSLPCGINHVRQELASRKLQPPEDYRPAPYRKDSFFEVVRETAYYRGEWSHGEPEGEGEVVFRDCSYFRGYFKNMEARGPECLFVLADGAYYLGAVAHNKRDGKGLFCDRTYSYEGEWLNNLPHGHGRETFPNGDSFEGRFRQGQRAGSGLYSWAAGPYQRYEGTFEGNVPAQRGVLVTREGAEVGGQFDCAEHFDIASCAIKAKQYQLANVLVSDGAIQSFAFNSHTFTSSGNGFKRKQLVFRGEASEATISAVVESIERGYRQARKHSEALEEIRKALPRFRCEWWWEGEQKNGLLIAEICGRKIKVSQK